jgi:uncharacterized membrane protein YgcG
MGVFLRRFRQAILLFLGIFFLIESGTFCSAQIPQERPDPAKHCFDFAQTLSEDLISKIDAEFSALKRHYDIDFVCIILPELREEDGDILDFATRIFQQWGIGASTKGAKGFLFLISMKEQKIKIEVGHDLEEIFTNEYVEQMQKEIFKEMLEQGEWEVAFLASMENIVTRINKFYNQGVDVQAISTYQGGSLSGGAGATTVFDFAAALKKPLPQLPAQVREYFSAQPTPELCFQRYLDSLAKNISDYTLELFTAESQKFFQTHPTSTGQRRSEIEDMDGKGYYVRQKNNHAVVIFAANDKKDTLTLIVYFLRNSGHGWQMDMNTMTRSLQYVGPNWLAMSELFHPYSEILMQEYNIVDGFFKRWDDPGGYIPFYRLGEGLYDENIPGFRIGVPESREKISSLKTGDIVLAINGEKIRDWKHLFSFFNDAPAGSSYKITLERDGEQITVTETLTGYTDGFETFKKYLQTPRMWLGVYMAQSTDREWRETRKMRDEGKFRYSGLCSILEVCPDSPADKAGLKPMDLIVDYGKDDDNGEIMSDDIMKCLAATKPGESIEFTVVRDLKDIITTTVTPKESRDKEYF